MEPALCSVHVLRVWDSDRIAEQSVPEVADGEEDIIREDAMQELLRAVDLEYLLERHGMHTVLDWGHILSLGAPPPTRCCPCAPTLYCRSTWPPS